MKILKYFELLKENKELKELNEEKRRIAILDNRTNYKLRKEIERLNNIINRTTKYVESLSSSGRGCDIYDDIKQEILKELKGVDKE